VFLGGATLWKLPEPSGRRTNVPTMGISKDLVAVVQQELAELEAAQRRQNLAPRAKRRVTGASAVFSVRLDPAEVDALETRAAAAGLKPSVLARNLIRTGLAARNGATLARAVDRLDSAVEELRGLVGG
jgi:hypothetical protein